MPEPIRGDVLDRELRYAKALGVVKRYAVAGNPGRDGLTYRRFHVTDANGIVHTFGPAQVMAFALGVRLASTRGTP